MNMSKKYALFLALEYHWKCIIAGRKKLARLYQHGFALSSPEMLRVNDRLSQHCFKVTVFTEQFTAMTSIK